MGELVALDIVTNQPERARFSHQLKSDSKVPFPMNQQIHVLNDREKDEQKDTTGRDSISFPK